MIFCIYKVIISSDVPIVTMRLGMHVNPEVIVEGDDVYFECSVRSNPKFLRLEWYKNVSIVNDLFVSIQF